MKLANRNAIITGASQGFGRTLAEAFVAEGASVFLCARNPEPLEKARQEIASLAQNKQQVLSCACDVSKPEEVDHLIRSALDSFGQIQILVNNAGVYGPMGNIETVDWPDWVRAIEINLYSVVLTSMAVIPHFRQQGYGKVITLSGGGATNPLPGISAYAASKAAVVRFCETLAEEVRGSGIDVNTVAPGALNTRLLDEVIAAGPQKVGKDFHEKMLKIKREGGAPMEQGAKLCVFLGSAASDGITGKLISAIWDPWEALPEHLNDLEGDVYTLRRIIPRDRGLEWGE